MSVKSTRAKYFADLDAKKEIEVKNMRGKEKKSQRRKEKRELPKTSQLEKVSSRIKQTEMCLKSAEESILKGNDDLKKLFFKKSLNRDAIRQAQTLTDMRVERKRALEKTIDEWEKKRKSYVNGIPMIFVSFAAFTFYSSESFVCLVATA